MVENEREDQMHYGRITTVVGSVLAIIGFGLKSASSGAEPLMPALNLANSLIPSEFERIVVKIWDRSAAGAIVLILALAVILVVTLLPDLKEAMGRLNALIVTVMGVVLLIGGIIVAGKAISDADDLQGAFSAMALGELIPQAFTVDVSLGWYMIPLGGAVAAIGGVLQLIARPDENALSE